MKEKKLTLHSSLGANARLQMEHCPICLSETAGAVVLLGHANYKDVCRSCGTQIFGGISSRAECPRCAASGRWERKELTPNEKVNVSKVCDSCTDMMSKGILLIEVVGEEGQQWILWQCSNGHSLATLVGNPEPSEPVCSKCGEPLVGRAPKPIDPQNPPRTGAMAVIKEEALNRIGLNDPNLCDRILKARCTFLPSRVWDALGLPRENKAFEEEEEEENGDG